MILRPYQKDAVRRTVKDLLSWNPRRWRTLIVMPTGTGKTEVLKGIISALYAKKASLKVLFVVSDKNLLYQSARRLRHDGHRVDLIGDGIDDMDASSKVVVATVQSLQRAERLVAVGGFGFDLIVIDETHHAITDTHLAVLVECLHNKWDTRVLGVTATPERGDGIPLGYVFTNVSYIKDISFFVKKKYLAKPVQITTGDSLPELFDKWEELASDRKSLVFCSNIKQAWVARGLWKSAGYSTAVVVGTTPYHLREWAEDNVQVVFCVAVYIEGRDISGIGCIVETSVSKTKGRYMQKIGRGLRPDTNDCLVIAPDHKGHCIMQPYPKDVLGKVISGQYLENKSLRERQLLSVTSLIKQAWRSFMPRTTGDITMIDTSQMIGELGIFSNLEDTDGMRRQLESLYDSCERKHGKPDLIKVNGLHKEEVVAKFSSDKELTMLGPKSGPTLTNVLYFYIGVRRGAIDLEVVHRDEGTQVAVGENDVIPDEGGDDDETGAMNFLKLVIDDAELSHLATESDRQSVAWFFGDGAVEEEIDVDVMVEEVDGWSDTIYGSAVMDDGALAIIFTRDRGKVYCLPDVPDEVIESFFDSASPGSFFNNHLRDSYPGGYVLEMTEEEVENLFS